MGINELMLNLSDWNRFWSKVDKTSPTGCWFWIGLTNKGYGKISINGHERSTHRIAFVSCGGVLAEATELDHLCGHPSCVNPRHLEAVSHRVNCIRGKCAEVTRLRNHLRTHCKRGHLLVGENLYRKSDGERVCRECMRMHGREYERRSEHRKKHRENRKKYQHEYYQNNLEKLLAYKRKYYYDTKARS